MVRKLGSFFGRLEEVEDSLGRAKEALMHTRPYEPVDSPYNKELLNEIKFYIGQASRNLEAVAAAQET